MTHRDVDAPRFVECEDDGAGEIACCISMSAIVHTKREASVCDFRTASVLKTSN